MFWSKKKKTTESETLHLDKIALEWYLKGIDRGIELSSMVDSKIIDNIKNKAIDEAIARLNGNSIQKT